MTKPSQASVLYTIIAGVGVAALIALGSIAWSSKADASDVERDMLRLEGKIDQIHLALCFSRREVPGCGYKIPQGSK